MSHSLAAFQSDFAQALFAPHGNSTGLAAQPAFAVYRNTVMKGCIDALEANYPAVARLVGSEWFRAAAAIHVVRQPPADAALVHYGADFAGLLADFEPARELPYLSFVARLDRFWTEAHTALDSATLDAMVLATMPHEALGATTLVPHLAARWRWFEDMPVYTIWSRNRIDAVPSDEIDWRAEGALVTRPADAVIWCEINRADCAFLDACAAGQPMAAAAEAALTVDPDCDLSALLARLLRQGAFAGTTP